MLPTLSSPYTFTQTHSISHFRSLASSLSLSFPPSPTLARARSLVLFTLPIFFLLPSLTRTILIPILCPPPLSLCLSFALPLSVSPLQSLTRFFRSFDIYIALMYQYISCTLSLALSCIITSLRPLFLFVLFLPHPRCYFFFSTRNLIDIPAASLCVISFCCVFCSAAMMRLNMFSHMNVHA